MNNTVLRSITGLGFLAVMIGGLLWCKFSFAAIILTIMVMMLVEFYRMTMGTSYKFSRILAILAGAILFILTFLSKSYEEIPGKFVFLSIIPVFIVMVNSLYVKDKTEFGKFANLYAGILYIAVPMTLTNFAVFDSGFNYNGLTLICFFAIIWGSDVGAYVFGCTLGQKYGGKLFPEISPKKSWIGFWGGFVTAVAVAVGLHYAGWLELPLGYCIILAVLMDIAGVYGDLLESQWKRHYVLKDSGHGIPGHGGFLDRFDSSLLAIPMGIICLEVFSML